MYNQKIYKMQINNHNHVLLFIIIIIIHLIKLMKVLLKDHPMLKKQDNH